MQRVNNVVGIHRRDSQMEAEACIVELSVDRAGLSLEVNLSRTSDYCTCANENIPLPPAGRVRPWIA